MSDIKTNPTISFTTRFSQPLIQPLDQLAAAHGLSRNGYLEYLAQQAVRTGFIPINNGEGFKATSPTNVCVTFIKEETVITNGQQLLAKSEQFTFLRARKLAEQDKWLAVKQLLIHAGFIVTHLTVEESV